MILCSIFPLALFSLLGLHKEAHNMKPPPWFSIVELYLLGQSLGCCPLDRLGCYRGSSKYHGRNEVQPVFPNMSVALVKKQTIDLVITDTQMNRS
mmetsp:Transcript_36128/g.66664  ORF Transcript_36128/g.66664 Transcript_36128/m.66664 type:complete len:95 (+) Transcript_36128:901-1185(+)